MHPSDQPQLAREAAMGGLWTSLQSVLNKVVAAVALLVVALFLSPEEFGDANRALAALAFLSVFTPLAMGDVLVAHQRILPTLARAGDRIGLLAGVSMATFVVVATPLLAHALPDDGQRLFLPLMLVIAVRPLLEAVVVAPQALLRSDLRYRTIAMIDGIAQLLASLATVAMSMLGAGAFSLVVPQVLALGARGLAYRRCAKPTPRPASMRRATRLLLAPFVFGSLAQYVHNVLVTLEVLALSVCSGSVEVGLFAFAFTLASQANVVIAFQLGAVLQPIFGRIGSDPLRQAHALLRTIRVLGAVIVPLSTLQAAVAPTLFGAVLPERWEPAMPAFIGLCALQAVYFGNAPLMSYLKARRRFRGFLAWQCTQLLVSAGVFAWIARTHGAAGVALASACVWGVAVPLVTCIALRGTGVRSPAVLSAFFRPWLAAIPSGIAVAALGLSLVPAPAWVQVVFVGLAAAAALACALVATRWTDPLAWSDVRIPLIKVRARVGSRG